MSGCAEPTREGTDGKKLTSLGEVWPQRLYQNSHHLTSNWVTDANLCKPICLLLSTNLTKQIVLKLLFLKYKKKKQTSRLPVAIRKTMKKRNWLMDKWLLC